VVHETGNGEALLLPQAKLVFPHNLVIRQCILSIKEVLEVYCSKELCDLRTTQLLSTGGIRIRKLVDQRTNDILVDSRVESRNRHCTGKMQRRHSVGPYIWTLWDVEYILVKAAGETTRSANGALGLP